MRRGQGARRFVARARERIMKTTKTLLLTIFAISATAQVAAGESHAISELKAGQQRQAVARLKEAEANLDRRADKKKGGARKVLILGQQRINGLAGDLVRGDE